MRARLLIVALSVLLLIPAASAAACGRTPRDATLRYYRAVSAKRYRTAWNCLRTATRKAFGGYAKWRRGYNTTAWVHVLSARTTDQAAGLGHVKVKIRSCRRTGSRALVEVFSGSWFAEDGYAGWRIGAPHARLVRRARHSAC